MSKVVVGIDFGTSGIGYAYGFTNKLDNIVFELIYINISISDIKSHLFLLIKFSS